MSFFALLFYLNDRKFVVEDAENIRGFNPEWVTHPELWSEEPSNIGGKADFTIVHIGTKADCSARLPIFMNFNTKSFSNLTRNPKEFDYHCSTEMTSLKEELRSAHESIKLLNERCNKLESKTENLSKSAPEILSNTEVSSLLFRRPTMETLMKFLRQNLGDELHKLRLGVDTWSTIDREFRDKLEDLMGVLVEQSLRGQKQDMAIHSRELLTLKKQFQQMLHNKKFIHKVERNQIYETGKKFEGETNAIQRTNSRFPTL